jgi:hypothetical protein
MPNNENPDELDPTDWDNITKEDLEILANMKFHLDAQRKKEKDKLRELRRIWDPALDMANDPELFGYNVPVED